MNIENLREVQSLIKYIMISMANSTLSSSPPLLTLEEYRKIKNAIRKEDLTYLEKYIMEPKPVNFSEDYLLHVLITSKKTNLLIKLVGKVNPAELLFEDKNILGDTALHVAAATGDVRAAEEMIRINKELLNSTNYKGEIPLHKAALFGKKHIFSKLVNSGSQVDARRDDGSNVLHCAIMGNNAELALEIAQNHSELKFGRNSRAVTPLQLIVTIPQAFRSGIHLGFVESLIYACVVPLNESTSNINSKGSKEGDEEKQKMTIPNKDDELLMEEDESTPWYMRKARKVFYIIMEFPVRPMRVFLIRVLKKMFTMVVEIEEQKKNHAYVLNLIGYLAKDLEYWDFIEKGRTPDHQGTDEQKFTNIESFVDELMDFSELMPPRSDSIVSTNSEEKKEDENKPKLGKEQVLLSPELEGLISNLSTTLRKLEKQKEDEAKKDLRPTRWDESPLTLGAKMGLHEFVEKILKVCPESAKYLDTDGRNVLQVAIQHGHVKIVDIIEAMVRGSDPVLPSWLLSFTDPDNNNILHFSAEETIRGDPSGLQMQLELLWFERVKKLVPKDLENSRNNKEKTAQELFTENHKEMVKKGKEQLTEMGKTCSGLVAAVVFASSFSIPGDKDANHNPVFKDKTAFKVFSHAYVFGLSCAATALVLFLALLTSRYRERDFRRSIPTKYFFAITSFSLALVSFLVTFSCNIYLNIYGGEKAHAENLLLLICELTIFPAVCCLVLVLSGSTLGFQYIRRHVLR